MESQQQHRDRGKGEWNRNSWTSAESQEGKGGEEEELLEKKAKDSREEIHTAHCPLETASTSQPVSLTEWWLVATKTGQGVKQQFRCES